MMNIKNIQIITLSYSMALHSVAWQNCPSSKKNPTTYCNCKRKFLLKRNTFNLNCAINYLMQVMYQFCSKKTIRSRH